MDCCTGALAFEVEYARWLEEQNRQTNELRAAVNSHAGDTELRIIVDNITAHFDDIFRLKGIAAKADVFHILSGMWKTPAERCFLWIGGFRSSELLKVSSILLLEESHQNLHILILLELDLLLICWFLNLNIIRKIFRALIVAFSICYFRFASSKLVIKQRVILFPCKSSNKIPKAKHE